MSEGNPVEEQQEHRHEAEEDTWEMARKKYSEDV